MAAAAARHHPRATTLGELPALAAERWEHDAVVLGSERLSFAEFEAAARRRAAELRGLGVDRGDRVGILMPNSLDYLTSIFGAAKLGAVPVPINHRFSAPELAHVIGDSELEVLLIAGGGVKDPTLAVETARRLLTEAAAPAAPCLRHVVDLAAAEDRPKVLGRAGLAAAGAGVDAEEVAALGAGVSIRDPAMIIYTSGTTSWPKGCVLNGEGLTRTAYTVAGERFGWTGADRCWDPLPFCHLSSLVILHACLTVGATFVSMARFEAGPALAQLAAECCTFAYPCFDTITAALQDHPDFAATDLSALRIVVTIGVGERLRAWQAAWPEGAVQLGAYGATEYSGVLCYNRPTDTPEQRFETCGPPIPGMEIRIVDPETGAPLPAGTRGELHCRGYGVFDGYFNDPEQTARVMTADGWIRSGDLVSRDADGYVTYLGRLKDMIKVGGENVAAAEIEDVLVTHPALREAQVVGLPDEKYVEVPAAFVEMRPGAEVGADELIAYCRAELAGFKVPRHVFFVTEWPMSETKIMKASLREQAVAELT